MPTCTPALSSDHRHRLTKLSSIFILMAACTPSHASEGEFVGLYGGTVLSSGADKTSNTFKILFGSHITSNLSLELGYMELGKTSYSDPTAINQDTSRNNISFVGTSHGSISHGQLGEPTVVVDGPDLYDDKGDSIFTGMSEFAPQGATVSLSYSYPLIENNLDIFVKAGFFAWWADYETVEITASKNGDISKQIADEGQTSAVNSITGAGLIYYPIPQLSLRAEIEATSISSGVMPTTRFQTVSIGANWEF